MDHTKINTATHPFFLLSLLSTIFLLLLYLNSPLLQLLPTSITITAEWVPSNCSTQGCLSTLQIFLSFGKYSSVHFRD